MTSASGRPIATNFSRGPKRQFSGEAEVAAQQSPKTLRRNTHGRAAKYPSHSRAYDRSYSFEKFIDTMRQPGPGPVGKTPDITMKPLIRLTRSHQRRIAG